MIWIDITAPRTLILEQLKKYHGFNYFPVCAGRIDAVIGILNARDYLQICLEQAVPHMQSIICPPLFIPESLTILRTLSLLKEHAVNSACIIDEYGGIEGFITKNGLLTAMLETSVQVSKGVNPGVIKQPDGSFVLNGQISFSELQLLHLFDAVTHGKKTEYHTLAGYLLTFTDAIPQEGDTIDTGTALFTITAMNGQRIEKVTVRPKERFAE